MTKTKITAYEPIDLCACFDMIFNPPAAIIREWEKEREERFMANKERGYYGIELDGTLYYYNGNTRIRVTEYFKESGPTLSDLVEDVILYKTNTKKIA